MRAAICRLEPSLRGGDGATPGAADHRVWRDRARVHGTFRPVSDDFDYVIVGAGSAGCVLAYRLTEDGRAQRPACSSSAAATARSVIQMPAALSFPMNMAEATTGASRPSPSRISAAARCHAARQGARRLLLDQRHGLCARPCRATSTTGPSRARRAGAIADVLPYFKRAESARRRRRRLARRRRAAARRATADARNPLYHAFVEAGRQAGFPTTDDFNGSKQEGFGPMDRPSTTAARWSAANAYLKPALKRPNLDGAHPRAGDAHRHRGRRAVGVEYRRGGDERQALRRAAR